ncbi:enoyl-CoA hydratase [Cladophialophora psammophila CBS 110553]|uniref:Probable enoyl-CoA hydratase, mitochondrial n=1 Tax=Cladophialophora psammophila CBS 110553 TaxID=1182543 RepID=W9VN38_9EURO|nr:enoyl-CoA hydratase [Cladophialophora psammophila CBS 110553]EXJ53546.1 enoyl-CoA hydratase [Cladophialophora psammophila CBS 110553]
MASVRLFSRPLATLSAAPRTLPRLVRFQSTSSSYENILVSTPRPGVGLITLNRPKALNALSSALFVELNDALKKYEEDKDIGAIVLTGSDKAFAAGADIKEMAPLTFSDAYVNNFIAPWSYMMTLRKPVIAAVSGHALGGGCELAMMCDILYCTKTANFGQPEIKLGTIPGAGGSQRLTAAIGKSKAMELILTGNNFSGEEAEKHGLAAKAFDGGNKEVLEGALNTAEKIASYSRVAVIAAKEVVNKSQDLGVREGVEYERRIFHSLFGSQDQKIGMKAFAEKKKAEWTHS